MGLFNAPSDIHWRNTVAQYQRSDTKVYYAKVIDADQDGNWESNRKQQVSVEIIGWDIIVKNCNIMVSNAGYNGEGEYQYFKKGDIVIGTAREGQLNDFIITGSVRLNGSYKDFEGEGKQLKPGESVEGELANQASLHPSRVTKLEGNFWMKTINGLKSLYQNPSNAEAVEEILEHQGLPGVIKLQTKEGVDMTYAYGGIVQYTEGNYIVVSGGSKINKCTKLLKQSKRHAEIANSLRALGKLEVFNNLKEIVDLESEDNLESIDATQPIKNLIDGEVANTKKAVKTQEYVEGLDPQEKLIGENEEVKDPSYRARKHTELSLIAAEAALNCNTTSSTFQQQSNLMTGQWGSFTNGGIAISAEPSNQPVGRIGQVNPQNYTNRGSSQNPKPPVEFIQAANFTVGQMSGPNYKLFLHHTAGTMESGIRAHQQKSTRASAHFFVGRDGRIVQMVKESNKAWHNGASNANAFGIEVVATKNEKGMTAVQEDALIKLCRYLCERYNITTNKVFGHNVVKSTECPTWIWPTQEDVKKWAELYLTI